MNASTTQIVELAKRGFEPSQIASALGLREEDVMLVVSHDRDAVKELMSLDQKFAKLEDLAIKGLEHLANYAENEETRRKTYEFILKQRSGLMKPRERVTIENNYQFLVERSEKAKALRDANVVDLKPA